MTRRFPNVSKILLSYMLGLLCALFPSLILAQQNAPATKPPATERRAVPAAAITTNEKRMESAGALPARLWQTRVSANPPYFVTLRATDAPLADVAAEISRKIKAPIMLSAVMQRQILNLRLDQVPVEAAARSIAPQAFVDYLLSGAHGTTPEIVAVYLFAFNENPPAESIATKNNSEVLIITGDTEEGAESEGTKVEDDKAKEDLPLNVEFANNQLSVRARKQPLITVLYEVAAKLGIPFDMQHETSEVVDLNFKNYSVEDAVRALTPLANLYSRTNLQTMETRPLRLVLSAPQKPKTSDH